MSALQRNLMNDTGIGFAGIDGSWWRPAASAVRWPADAATRLAEIGGAMFVLLDCVLDLYPRDRRLAALLDQRVPAELRAFAMPAPVLGLRPDFQVVERDGRLDFVATELEICPSAHGFAHAMQTGYGLRPDLVEGYLRVLAGRELLIVGASEWSEFLIEQLAFCRALQDAGGRARVLYDRPIAEIATEFAAGRLWQPPMFGVRQRTAGWNQDLMGRLVEHDLLRAVWPDDEQWPEELSDVLVFRFGYLECFPEYARVRLARWQRQGTPFVNPTHFALENKCLLAALALPTVRAAVTTRAPDALAVLDSCIPETLLLNEDAVQTLADERPRWITKFAGFDTGNQAWGGRSLVVGAAQSDDDWCRALEHATSMPWPVVAQRAVPSRREDVEWLDLDGSTHTAADAVSRLRTFLLRDGDSAIACGSHLTWSASSQVSEGEEAIQAPLAFG